ncbi:hypothetical protein K2173_027117 [Erythroxylum novogranatense]|uniref:Pentatricopeptide repeat-containing protein n=1 Tax=Erythroxylum novogranatense TaxID=1862640 RepID=A0AAV8TYA7_9ROSI|nr:hypothetical protein K2173_027117 [Erythroxylum novogranatense]
MALACVVRIASRPRPPLSLTITFSVSHRLTTTFFSSASDPDLSLPIATVAEEKLCINLLQKCLRFPNLHYVRAIHARFFRIPKLTTSSLYLLNNLISLYVKCNRLTYALKLFDQMSERNVVSWSVLIAGFVQRGCPDEALSLFLRMQREAVVSPNEFSLVSALNGCSFSQNLMLLYQIFSWVIRLGFECNVFLMNAFLTGLIRHGMLSDAKVVFDKRVSKDIVSWNAMMAGFLQHSYSQIPFFWHQMNGEGVKPDDFTFSTVFTGLASLADIKLGLQVHAQLVKSGHGVEICVGNSLSNMYIKNQRLNDAFKAFYEMPQKNVRSWTQMAAGALECGEPDRTLELVAELRVVGLMPNRFTLATAFDACAKLASLEEGKKFHGLRIKLGSQVDICVDNALLNMYAKCGCMDETWVVFQLGHDRSEITWTTMIMACAQNGQSKAALEIFEDMMFSDVEPNYITFICVLYACSQGRFIDKGWKYFFSMYNEHGISPGEEHYVCMVDLLGRAGQIKQAEDLILNMPFQPGVLVWKTLLGACHLHGDVETGNRAAQRAIDLDGKDSSTYVLLSNSFACQSNWENVGMMRELMDNRDVKKMPGSSWIEVEKRSPICPVWGLLT